ncbi:hypothetical protein [Polyangium fumosum]|uniref:Uncharacterized protein n=1 Tax=Polyangium fumosum TaxID=889272 RepID=A0A4U1J3H5_9BACT|nr:hypothetical protein [Polyangium fumosum]TKD01224.1 hypothetical protein E8A74_31995 [Polyangium fumosum]
MVRAGKRWFAWMVAACCAAVSAIAQAAPGDVEEETEEVADAESAFVGAGGFSAAYFPFVTIVADDGAGSAGGWQSAMAVLNFVDRRNLFSSNAWVCQVVVGMPIRHSVHGVITPQRAATVTAQAATSASSIVMKSQLNWLRATYCPAFAAELEAQLNMRMTRVGARVNAQ